MDTRIPKRWAEVQFYYIINDILKIRNNIMDVMQNIDYLSGIGKYNPEAVKEYAQEILSSPRVRPIKEETILLCRLNNIPVKIIKQKFKIHFQTLYKLFDKQEKDPMVFFPRFSDVQNEQIQLYINAFNTIKGVGLHD